jgi:phage gpG-like protein
VQEELRVIGLREAQDAIRRLGLAAKDTRRLRESLGEEMLFRTEKRFDAQIGPDGKPWPKSRRAEREGGQTLSRTGVLRSRIGYDARGDDLELYSWDRRARVHQLGLTIEPTAGHQYLSIPLRAADGNFERAERPVISRKGRDGRRAKHYGQDKTGSGATWVARVHGKLFIFQATGSGPRALFLLVRSVTMPARPFLGFSDDDLAMVLVVFGNYFGTAFNGGT